MLLQMLEVLVCKHGILESSIFHESILMSEFRHQAQKVFKVHQR